MSLTQSEENALKKLINDLDSCEKSMNIIQDQLKVQDGILQKVQEDIESKVQLQSFEDKNAENDKSVESLASEYDDLNPFKHVNDKVESLTSEFDSFKPQPTYEKVLENVKQSGDGALSNHFMSSELFDKRIKSGKKHKSKARKLFNKMLFWKGKKTVKIEAADEKCQMQESCNE